MFLLSIVGMLLSCTSKEVEDTSEPDVVVQPTYCELLGLPEQPFSDTPSGLAMVLYLGTLL